MSWSNGGLHLIPKKHRGLAPSNTMTALPVNSD
jgi:hypothetical protein